jgi:hypothetical protein
MDLSELLSFISFICNKEQSGNTMSPSQYNTLLPVANTMLFREKYKYFETSQQFSDALLPFKVWMGKDGVAPLFIDSNGYANIPSDYCHYSSFSYKRVTSTNTGDASCEPTIDYRQIIVLSDQEYDYYKTCGLKRPNFKYPVCNFQNGMIRFLPVNLQQVDFVYLKNPAKPVYAYTFNTVTDYYDYDVANSVQLEWKEPEVLELANIILSMIGINLRESELFTYAQLRESENKLDNKS